LTVPVRMKTWWWRSPEDAPDLARWCPKTDCRSEWNWAENSGQTSTCSPLSSSCSWTHLVCPLSAAPPVDSPLSQILPTTQTHLFPQDPLHGLGSRCERIFCPNRHGRMHGLKSGRTYPGERREGRISRGCPSSYWGRVWGYAPSPDF